MRAIRPTAMLPTLLLSAVLVAVPPTQGAPAEPDARADSGWAKLNTKTVTNIAQTDMLRTPDGVLHVVYPQEVGVNDEYEHTTVSTTGAVLGHSTAVANWGALTNDPVLLPTPAGGLQIVFGGLQDVDVTNPYSAGHLYRAVSDASGASWGVQAEALVKSGYGYASYGTGATLLPDGTSIQGYPLNSEFTFRVGTTPLPVSDATPPDQGFGLTGSSLLHATLVQQGGNVWAAWYDQGDNNGVFVRQIYPSLGVVYKAPGQSADTLNPGQAIPMVVRPDGSIVLAYCLGYPTCSSVGVWQVGTTTVHKVPGSKESHAITMDTGPTGRLWVAWANDDEILATRSSTTGFTFGALRQAGSPNKDYVYGLQVEASRGEASVVANDALGIYHRQLQPGLALKANPKSWDGDKKKKVTFVVTDASSPIAGVKVKGGGEKCTTNAQGKCSVTYAPQKPHTIKVNASLTGFSDAVTKLKVKP
ncbi:MAG: hypothetical protein ABIR39_24135 [Nocardioides sp.]|uniref:hypothetical protein n=1 Tax=Nocardioides sp. TaxID=35761 RepID=UPI003267D36E